MHSLDMSKCVANQFVLEEPLQDLRMMLRFLSADNPIYQVKPCLYDGRRERMDAHKILSPNGH